MRELKSQVGEHWKLFFDFGTNLSHERGFSSSFSISVSRFRWFKAVRAWANERPFPNY
jgi:hypothetical protein